MSARERERTREPFQLREKTPKGDSSWVVGGAIDGGAMEGGAIALREPDLRDAADACPDGGMRRASRDARTTESTLKRAHGPAVRKTLPRVPHIVGHYGNVTERETLSSSATKREKRESSDAELEAGRSALCRPRLAFSLALDSPSNSSDRIPELRTHTHTHTHV